MLSLPEIWTSVQYNMAWIILAHTLIYFNSQLKASESCMDRLQRQVVGVR